MEVFVSQVGIAVWSGFKRNCKQGKKTSTTFLRGTEETRVQCLCPGSVGTKKDFSCQLIFQTNDNMH